MFTDKFAARYLLFAKVSTLSANSSVDSALRIDIDSASMNWKKRSETSKGKRIQKKKMEEKRRKGEKEGMKKHKRKKEEVKERKRKGSRTESTAKRRD